MEIVWKDGKCYFSRQGNLFKMKGINHFTNSPGIDRVTGKDTYREYCEKKYASEEEWYSDNAELLKSIGFNTVGAFSRYHGKGLFKTDIIYLSGNKPGSPVPVSDFFSEEWEAFVKKTVAEQLPGKTMVYLENEMKIGRDWTSYSLSLAHGYLNMGAQHPGKRAVIRFVKHLLRGRLGLWNAATLRRFKTWDEALACTDYRRIFFLEGKIIGFIMRKFYRTCRREIKALDPGVLIGGSRLISWFTQRDALRACARYCDYVSVNYYWARFYLHNLTPAFFRYVIPAGGLSRFYRIAKKPIYVTEFGFIGENGINRNKHPAVYKKYVNQKKRADALARYLKNINRNWIIGIDLFEFVDQPENGRDMKDCEDNNFGIIDRTGKVYREYADTLRDFFENRFL